MSALCVIAHLFSRRATIAHCRVLNAHGRLARSRDPVMVSLNWPEHAGPSQQLKPCSQGIDQPPRRKRSSRNWFLPRPSWEYLPRNI